MIYLDASEEQLREHAAEYDTVPFWEEDFDNKLTSIACVTTDRKRFAKYKLVGA